MNLFNIYLAIVVVSFIGTIGSIYGMGLNDHDKNSTKYTVANAFFNISLMGLLASSILLIKNSQATMVCKRTSLSSPSGGNGNPKLAEAVRPEPQFFGKDVPDILKPEY